MGGARLWDPQKNKAPGGFPPGALIGAGDEIRTHDFNLGKVALYP